jgi:hypothetical protein
MERLSNLTSISSFSADKLLSLYRNIYNAKEIQKDEIIKEINEYMFILKNNLENFRKLKPDLIRDLNTLIQTISP